MNTQIRAQFRKTLWPQYKEKTGFNQTVYEQINQDTVAVITKEVATLSGTKEETGLPSESFFIFIRG